MLIDIRLRPDATAEEFEAALRQIPAGTEALHVTGSFDYLIRATIPDAAHLDQLIRALKHTAGADETHTRLAAPQRTQTQTDRPPVDDRLPADGLLLRGLTLECTPRHSIQGCPLRRRPPSTAAALRTPL